MGSSLIRSRYLVSRAGADAASSTVISDGTIFQREGIIEDVGTYATLKSTYDADEEIGGPEYIAIPGLVNAHHHGRGVTTFQMGTPDDSLETWILGGWGRRPYDHYLMTLYTAMQMIESGTTTVMYNHPQTPVSTIETDIDDTLRGFGDAGMRTAFSLYFRNQNRIVYDDDDKFMAGLPADLSAQLRQYISRTGMSSNDYFAFFEALHNRYNKDPANKVRVLLSPSNVQWASDDFLQETKEYASKYQTGIHMHLVESMYQKAYGLRTWGKTPVAHLSELEFLGPEVSFAHGVWVTDEDIDLLASSDSTVCHNSSSNLRLKSGVAPVNRMLARGVNLAVGTDSNGINDDDDMLQEMRLVSKIHREPGIEAPAINSHQVLRMATINASAPTFFHDQIGTLEIGRRADVVLLDLAAIEHPYFDPGLDVVDALLYRGKARHVDTVVIDGEVVLRNRVFTKLNKDDVAKEMKERFSIPADAALAEIRRMVQQLLPYVKKFYAGWETGQGPSHYSYNSRSTA